MRLPSLLIATALASAAGLAADTVDFHEHLGLQLYSLRGQITMNPPGTLDLARSYGITEVETAGTANLPVERFSALLKERGLQAIGAHMGYDLLKKNFAGALRDAKALGITYLTVPSVPSEKGKGLTAKAAHEAAANLDAWGKALRAEGIILCYHPHGFEFRPLPEEGGATGYDILVRETRPENLHLEIDVFWAYHAGQDPAGLGAKGEDMPGFHEIRRLGPGGDQGLDGAGAVMGGDAGGGPFAGFHAHAEGRFEGAGVVLDHLGYVQAVQAFPFEGRADEAPAVGGHEGDGFRRHMLGREGEISFVFAVLVVHDDHHAPLADGFDGIFNGGEGCGHGTSRKED